MLTNLRMALKALSQNKLQSILTLLGMSVGVAMVVVVSGLGLGAQQRIESQIESAGPTRISIHPGNFVPAGADTSGEQDSGGGEPGEGSTSINAGGDSAQAGSAAPDSTQDSALIDARRRIRAVKKTVYLSPPTPLRPSDLALIRATPGVKSVAGGMSGNIGVDPGTDLSVTTVRISGFDSAWPDMTGWKLVEGAPAVRR